VQVYWSAGWFIADVPPGVVTVTSMVPAAWGGMITVIVVALVTDTGVVLDMLPNFTAVAPVKPVPVIVTVIPPDAGPDPGETPVTVGAAKYVN